MAPSKTVAITTARGISCQVRVWDQPEHGASAIPIVFFHSVAGLFDDEPMLDELGKRYEVYAPVWPGFGAEPGEELIDDMLDFTLHGWDVVSYLEAEAGFNAPHLVGHGMGAMIAAEMAAVAPRQFDRLALLDPVGLWVDAHPCPDVFTMMPFEFPEYLFSDGPKGVALLAGGLDFEDPKAIENFLVNNSRRLGTAGKILFPIPNRRLSKRLYRVTDPTALIWGAQDRLVPVDPYAAAWQAAIPHAALTVIEGAGHMVNQEQPVAAAEAIKAHLG